MADEDNDEEFEEEEPEDLDEEDLEALSEDEDILEEDDDDAIADEDEDVLEEDEDAAPAATAKTTIPARRGTASRTGGNAPATHVSWNRVSKRAKARPWDASGASRCTIESNASLPPAAAAPRSPARAAPAARLPYHAHTAAPIAKAVNEAVSIRSSVT